MITNDVTVHERVVLAVYDQQDIEKMIASRACEEVREFTGATGEGTAEVRFENKDAGVRGHQLRATVTVKIPLEK